MTIALTSTMIRPRALLLAALLGLLAACGVDGEPEAPATPPPPGLHLSGEASTGVVGSL